MENRVPKLLDGEDPEEKDYDDMSEEEEDDGTPDQHGGDRMDVED